MYNTHEAKRKEDQWEKLLFDTDYFCSTQRKTLPGDHEFESLNFCACWRQGIVREKNKRTTLLQAHYKKKEAFIH